LAFAPETTATAATRAGKRAATHRFGLPEIEATG
jgi:hypothetical protein